MGLTLADPYFAQQIIQKYSIFGTGFSEAVDFVYYAPETQEKRTYQTNLFLQMFFRFQMIHLNTFISAGNQWIMDQVLSHAMNRILLRILTKKEQHAALFKLDRILKEIQKNAAAKVHSAKKEERLMKESMRFLTFLKEHPELLSEREILVRLADESGGKKAEHLIHQYFFRPEESASNNEEQKEQLQAILQNIVKKNQRQLSALFQDVEEKLQYQNDRQIVTSGTMSRFRQAGMTEGRLLYETVRLLFRDSGNHNREWEQLMLLTGRRLGPEAERRLRKECEAGLEMDSRQEIENEILEAFYTKVSGRENEGRKSLTMGMSGMPGIQGIEKPVRRIKAFTGTIRKQPGTLSAEAMSRLARPLDPMKALGVDQQSFSMKSQIPHLNIRRESKKRGKAGEQLESMPSAPLQLMQRKRQREQVLKENRSRIQKLEEQVQIQQRTVTRLMEGQRIPVQTPLPDVNDLTRRVMSNLERELRLEKMRKGLL